MQSIMLLVDTPIRRIIGFQYNLGELYRLALLLTQLADRKNYEYD